MSGIPGAGIDAIPGAGMGGIQVTERGDFVLSRVKRSGAYHLSNITHVLNITDQELDKEGDVSNHLSSVNSRT